MSVCDRLFAVNMAFSWSRSNDGGGRFPSTLLASELSPSSLPSSTAYAGPPACRKKKTEKDAQFSETLAADMSSKARKLLVDLEK